MVHKIIVIMSASLIASFALAQAPMTIDESTVVKLLESSSPQLKQVRSQSSLAQFQAAGTASRFETTANASYSYGETNEDGIVSFSPEFSPAKVLSVGVSKMTPYGIKVSAEGTGTSYSTEDGSVDNATRVRSKVSLDIDLLKNFLGRTDAAELKSQKLTAERSKLQSQISQKEIQIEARKLYWSLVANDLSLNLSKSLVASAKTQLRDMQRRSRSGAADRGDVARNRALLASRESSVKLFEYEKMRLESQLKKWVPDLSNKIIRVTAREIDQRALQVNACIAEIEKSQTANEKSSDYFEFVNLLEKEYKAQKRKANATGDWDLKLSSYYQSSAVDKGFSDTLDAYGDSRKDGYGVGVSLSIPLEGKASRSEKLQKLYVNQRYESEIRNIKQKINETHNEVRGALVLLREATLAQKANVDSLTISLKSSQRKYRQARITLSQLILEQDTLFNSRLQEIKTKVSVIHAMYDYFKVFNKHSCALNKIEGSAI